MAVKFDQKQQQEFEALVSRYPNRKAALGEVIHLAQKSFGHVGPEVEQYLGELMGLPVTYVREVVTFYSMYHQRPKGTHLLMVCDNISCMLCGAEDLVGHLKARLGIEAGQTTPDGRFTLLTVECLGACEMAPVMMIDERYYGNLTRGKIDELLASLE